MVVVAVTLPEVPVIVTVGVPAGSEAAAVKVTTLEPVVGLLPKAAVTPLGRLEAARVTGAVNPFKSRTEMVSVALAPSATDMVDVGDDSVKLGVVLLLLHVVPLIVKLVGIALVTPFQLALNPT